MIYQQTVSDHRVVYFSELQEQVTGLQTDKRWLQSELEEKKLSLEKCQVCYLFYFLLLLFLSLLFYFNVFFFIATFYI